MSKVRSLATMVAIAILSVSSMTAYAVDPDNIVPTNAWNLDCENQTQATSRRVCQTDNASMGWWMERPIDTTSSNHDTPIEYGINLAMNNSFDGTDLNTFYDSTPVTSGSGETDLMYRSNDEDFGTTSLIGIYWCDDAVNGTSWKCDQGYVNFRSTVYGRELACHETGHSVGLLHGNYAYPTLSKTDSRLHCMVSAVNPNEYLLGTMNVTNINNVYPN